MILTFTFSINQETKEAVFTGNIEPVAALHILQDLVVTEMMRRANNNGSKPVEQEVKQ